MVELYPAPFADLVARMHLEFERQDAIFDLPRRKWYVPKPDGPDLSVQFHGHRAANPLGPASGPQTQMAQNIVLSWLAGGRIHELKTVQINDRLTIPRPCIDATNVGYNVEWSQELRIAESLREYVSGSMLVHMLRQHSAVSTQQSALDTIYDLSVGYDLKGIQSEPVVAFINGMKDASAEVDRLRLRIPAPWAHLRDLDYPTHLCTAITLSTFHGCPAGEIERICEFILNELDMDVVVKMNPPMLGKERLEHLLRDVLGYHEITVNPSAYSSGLQFDESLAMCARLTDLARRRGRQVGAKFSNTLEVTNHRDFFTKDNQVMYLSGAPLHVITLTLADVFRQAVGPELTLTFSAGVDKHNFANMVACGFCPVSTCTDLLKPGGYSRMPAYLEDLAQKMQKAGARTIDDYVLDARGAREAAQGGVKVAAAMNLRTIAEETRGQERYRAAQNRSIPKRIGTHLVLFDCVSCDKCIPVCPNDANFLYELPIQRLDFTDWIAYPDGRIEPGEPGTIEIERQHQIANFADFCNECGNCDTFCPEYGGPFIEKPTFFGSMSAWESFSKRDGFYIDFSGSNRRIVGRIRGAQYELVQSREGFQFRDRIVEATFGPIPLLPPASGPLVTPPQSVTTIDPDQAISIRIDMRVFHTLRLLLEGVASTHHINQMNASLAAAST